MHFGKPGYPCNMATPRVRRTRQRDEIKTLPSGSLCVRVYAGVDPITGKRHYLTEIVPAGPDAATVPEKTRTRFRLRWTSGAALEPTRPLPSSWTNTASCSTSSS